MIGTQYASDITQSPDSMNRWIPGKRLGMTISEATGACGNEFGVAADDNTKRVQEVIEFATEYINEIRKDMASMFELMLVYTVGENPILRSFMTLDYWYMSSELSTMSFSYVERSVDDSITKILIGELLSSSRCFLECNHRANAHAYCSDYNKIYLNYNGTNYAHKELQQHEPTQIERHRFW
jgi:hypothetical protein